MYFCLDESAREIVQDNGDRFTADQFKRIIEGLNWAPVDMTLMVQRFVSFGFDWNKLAEFYD